MILTINTYVFNKFIKLVMMIKRIGCIVLEL